MLKSVLFGNICERSSIRCHDITRTVSRHMWPYYANVQDATVRALGRMLVFKEILVICDSFKSVYEYVKYQIRIKRLVFFLIPKM